jgi:hypothetical protein
MAVPSSLFSFLLFYFMGHYQCLEDKVNFFDSYTLRSYHVQFSFFFFALFLQPGLRRYLYEIHLRNVYRDYVYSQLN